MFFIFVHKTILILINDTSNFIRDLYYPLPILYTFLAAKRSSAPALIFCLSVCFETEFLTVWSLFDS